MDTPAHVSSQAKLNRRHITAIQGVSLGNQPNSLWPGSYHFHKHPAKTCNDPDSLQLATLLRLLYQITYRKKRKVILPVVEPRLLRLSYTLPVDPKPNCIFFPHNHRNHPERNYCKFVSNIRQFRAASFILNQRLKRSRFMAI